MRAKSVLPFLILMASVAVAQPTRRDMLVSTEWLAEHLPRVIVIDVADKNDYEKGHIPSARLLEKRDLMVQVDGVPHELPPLAEFEQLMTALGVDEKTRVVFYSRDPLLATRAWFTFDYFGHGHRAAVLNGGLARWMSEGRAMTQDVPAYEPAPFTAEPNTAALTDLKVMALLVRQRNALGEDLVVIDARPVQSYRGQIAGQGVERAGHIPGAISVPWQRNLAEIADGALFLSDDALRALYAKLSLTRGKTVIVYCRTGVEASMTYFLLRYLGYDASLYDGSFVQWSRSSSTPVV